MAGFLLQGPLLHYIPTASVKQSLPSKDDYQLPYIAASDREAIKQNLVQHYKGNKKEKELRLLMFIVTNRARLVFDTHTHTHPHTHTFILLCGVDTSQMYQDRHRYKSGFWCCIQIHLCF